MDESDHELLKIIRNYLDDMFDNTYNGLINEVFRQIKENSDSQERDHNGVNPTFFDNYHFFKFSAFMIHILRLKAYKKQSQLK